MKVEHTDNNEEHRILTAMIVDQQVLGRIATKWGKEMFQSKWADLIGKWCIDYHQQYGKAPKRHIEGLFTAWAEQSKDDDTVRLIERFLGALSDEYKSLKEGLNVDYMVDLAARHFTRAHISRLIQQTQADLDAGRVEKADERLGGYRKVELGTEAATDILNDKQAIQEALDDRQEEDLIVYPGALGYFFRGQLGRDCFVVFMGPEKRGKSFWLIDMGWRAMCQRRRVAWFAAGDMSRKQMMRRFMARAARRPVRAKEWPVTVEYPVKMRRVDDLVQVRMEKKVFQRPLDWQTAWRACQEITQEKVRGKEYLRLSCHSNSSLSMKSVDAQLERWAQEGWNADVVIVDYADIMDEAAAAPGIMEKRHRVDANWKLMRKLSQDRHLLFVTATQSDAESYSAETINRTHFSESKTKHAHPTAVLGINQNVKDRKVNAFRLNWVALRDGFYDDQYSVACAACLPLANPCVLSCP